ncbi:hypothetical protein CPB84DRAFT_1958196 [Gymnopilus junonius]|uniref:CSN8/PSMD8/EIF3K domain-containing protein n=1 Tax=Gymnopilus junonius TaxID=109634 RepID=A0A9P5NZY9_GYMJU|nr:hypothetical protein CPB84DRAFT_1958196 [Gymnopilus junonius]
MVNGPPTPPATTPAELYDEGTSAAEVFPPLANRPEMYQTVIPLMGEAIAKHDYQSLVDLAEETDISTPNDRHPSRLLIVAPMVLGYLVRDDVSLARFALLRLPDSIASLPLPRALMALVTSAMNRHATIYDQTAALSNLVAQPDFVENGLGSTISTLLSAFIDHFRQRTFELLSKAYTSLPLPLACTYLALAPEQVISVGLLAAAQERSWSYDPSTQIFSPKTHVKANLRTGSLALSSSSLSTFHFVADSVARLEG